MEDNRTDADYAALEWDKQGMRLADDPAAVLALPEGLLMLEGLPIMLHGASEYPVTPDKVRAAAECIIAQRDGEQAQHVFHNQAEVMAFASQQFDWHTGKDMRFVSTANYMGLEKPSLAEREAKADLIDVHIEILNSGLLTTREGAKKLFPDMDVDAVFDKHEQRLAEAKEQQSKQTDDIMRRIREEKAAKGESADPAPAKDDKESWAQKVDTQRRNRPNPCLGF
jgi:hypothetical protein